MTTDSTQVADRHEATTPDPDDPRKPQTPAEIEKPSWKYIARRSWREFNEDQCTDLAAGLTYYAVFSLFPAILALMSLLSVIGKADEAVDAALQVLRPLVEPDLLGKVEPAMRDFAEAGAGGFTLLTTIVLGLWTASGYVNAFSRAMNRIYEIGEGRPVWKLRPQMLLVTLVLVLLVGALLLLLVISGDLARSIGNTIGLGEQGQQLWSILKWPASGIVAVLLIAILYWATPNIRQPKFRWLSVGAGVALVVWLIASLGFTFYVSNFSNYNRTYGSLAGVIVALLFLYLSNLALLLGAEVDAELERGRQLQAGIEAEHELQLPARDTRQIEKAEERRQEDLATGRALRRTAGRSEATGAGREAKPHLRSDDSRGTEAGRRGPGRDEGASPIGGIGLLVVYLSRVLRGRGRQ